MGIPLNIVVLENFAKLPKLTKFDETPREIVVYKIELNSMRNVLLAFNTWKIIKKLV